MVTPGLVERLLKLRGDVTGSVGTKILYGASGTFFLLLPLWIVFGFREHVEPAWAVVATALIWMIAAFHFFGLCVTYRFDSGVVKCLWFRRHIIWEEKLDKLEDIKSNFARGLSTIYLVWPDHRRRLWLRMSDLDSTNAMA